MSPRTHRPITATFPTHGVRVLSVDYRMVSLPFSCEGRETVLRCLVALTHNP